MKRIALGLAAAAGLLCSHCAPDNASEIRELKPESVGLWGFVHHPEGDKAIGVTGNYYKGTNVNTAAISQAIDPDRNPKVDNNWQVSAFYHHYPWKTSAFFVGFGAAYDANQIHWQEQTTAYTNANKATTEVKYSDRALYLRAPLGWSWIWNSGFTLLLDFGPGLRLTQSHKWVDDGTDDGVDTQRRDDFANKIKDPLLKWGASGMIGWSF